MKKIFFFAAAALMSTAMFAELQVATFEDVTLPGTETVLHLTETGNIQSGSFAFTQEVQDYYGSYYYYGNIVSNKTSNQYLGDWQNDMSASGGAYEGDNFVVWTMSYVGADKITLQNAAVVPGFYINNTPWVVYAILNGDGMSDDGNLPFGENDWFKLTVNGSLNGQAVNNEVKVELAKGTSYIQDWTYVDLSTLGEVDQITFSLSSTKKNSGGMTTPAYFAIDNFGAAAPATAISNTNAAEKAVKVIRNGQVVIIRGDKTYNVLGAEL